MSAEYAKIRYTGNATKLCEILKEKIDINEIKKVGIDKIFLSLPIGTMDDLMFLKSFLETEGIKIHNVINI